VLFYDAIFAAGSVVAAFRRNRVYYALLFASWILLGALNAAWPRGSTAGLSVRGVGVLSYALTQAGVLLHYVSLAVWPAGLCIDYGWKPVASIRDAIGPLAVVAVALGITIWACFRRPALGFVLSSFFLILAPTSSLVPLQNPAFDYRMYLPLAPVLVCFIVAVASLSGLGRGGAVQRPVSAVPLLVVAFVAAAALGWRTIERNRDYASALSIWSDVIAKRPSNHRGYIGVGIHHLEKREFDKATDYFTKALALYPDSRHAHYFMALTLLEQQQIDAALPHAEECVRLEPDLYEDRNLLGLLLSAKNRHEEAASQFQEAVRLNPESGPAHLGLARALVKLKRPDDARRHYLEAIRLGFQAPTAHVELADALLPAGRLAEAADHYAAALEQNPNWPPVVNRLGFTLLRLGNAEDAVRLLESAIRLDPALAPGHLNLGDALVSLNRFDEALAAYQEAMRLKPDLPKIRERIADAQAPPRTGVGPVTQPSTAPS